MSSTTLRRFAATLAMALASASMPLSAEPGVTADRIVIGRVADQSNFFAPLSKEFLDAAQLYFNAVNRAGGVRGRKIELRTVDDNYDPAKTVAAVKKMIDNDEVLAFLGIWGAPNNAQALPILTQAKVPGFFPINGAPAIRKANSPYYFTIYASFDDETEQMVSQLTGQGIKSIAVAHQANEFGRSGMTGAVEAITRRGLKPAAVVAFDPNSTDTKAAVDKAVAASPDAIIMIGGGKSVYDFIGEYKNRGAYTQFFTLSVVGSTGMIKALGDKAHGIAVAQAMPFPWNPTIPVVREFQTLMKEAGRTDYTYLQMTGFISAKAMVEILRRASPDITRAKLITAAQSLTNYDLGGYVVNFGPGRHNGSKFVELTIIGRKGEFLR